MADILTRQGWTSARWNHDDCDYSLVEEMIVILRDPVDRWTSGVAQYLVTKILNYVGPNTYIDKNSPIEAEDYPLSASSFVVAYNPLIERFVFENPDLLDDHVWSQCGFFENLIPDVNRRLIVLDDDFETSLNLIGIRTFADADRNASGNDKDKSILKNFFMSRIQAKPSLLKKIQMTYAKDYDIIARVVPGAIEYI